MREDYRLKDIHRIQKERIEQKFSDFFSQNPFPQIDIIIELLCNQFKLRIKEKGTSQKKVLLNELKLPLNVLNVIKEGDYFYDNLLNTEEWVSKDSTDLINKNPFTYSLTKVYNEIWGIRNENKSVELGIYNALQKYLFEQVGESIAHEAEYNTIEVWENIYITTYAFDGFYNKWLYNIDINLITSNLNELINIPSKIQLHELATFMDYRREKEEYTQAYLEKLKNLEQKSDWEFIREATRSSDLLCLEENLYLKENLILQANLRNWLKWVDNLKFPVLQDHVFDTIKKLDSFQEVIGFIISEKNNFKTKPERLLLIALKNWFELLENISSNLFHLKNGEWTGNYYNKEGFDDIIRQAESDFTNWTNKLLEEHCTIIFDLIFKTAPVSDSTDFSGVFEWINSYTRQSHLNKKYPEPYLKTLEIVAGKFQSLICADILNKNTIIDCIEQIKLSWQFLESFLGILMTDESDESFKGKLFLKYLSYIESPNFKWNISNEYNNEILDQACYFAYVISKQNNPFKIWEKLYQQYKCWHEGWNYNVFSSKNKTNIENYLLTVGVCLSYTLYKNNEQIEANSTFEKILNILFSQYRVSGKYKLTEYTVPLRFLSHTKAFFCSQEINDFVTQLSIKLDDIEDLLPVYYEICIVLKGQQRQLNNKAKNLIQSQITNNFWILGLRYKDNALKNQHRYFSELKKEINNFLSTT